MQVVSKGNNLYEMSKPVLLRKLRKKYQFVVCRINPETGKGHFGHAHKENDLMTDVINVESDNPVLPV